MSDEASLNRAASITQAPPTEEQQDIVRIKTLDSCDFPIVEREIPVEGGKTYRVLVLPRAVQDCFDKEGYHAVRINSTELAAKLPAFGGKTAASYSLLPHQDHFSHDRRRFLAISQESSGARDSQTYIARPEVIAASLPKMREYFDSHLNELKQIFVHEPSMQLPKEVLLSCFEDGGKGLDKVVAANLPPNAPETVKVFAYCGILAYLIQGPHADKVVGDFLNDNKDKVVSEEWKTGGTLILDNSRVFDGRFGPNATPLKRNWMIAE